MFEQYQDLRDLVELITTTDEEMSAMFRAAGNMLRCGTPRRVIHDHLIWMSEFCSPDPTEPYVEIFMEENMPEGATRATL